MGIEAGMIYQVCIYTTPFSFDKVSGLFHHSMQEHLGVIYEERKRAK